jgi:hypothetical protein
MGSPGDATHRPRNGALALPHHEGLLTQQNYSVFEREPVPDLDCGMDTGSRQEKVPKQETKARF